MTSRLSISTSQRISKAAKVLYYAAGVVESRRKGQGLNILFDAYGDYVDRLTFAFRYSPHRIRFEDLTTENIVANDLVIPLTTDAVWFVDEHRDLLSNNPIPLTLRSVVDTFDDKYLFSRALTNAGFSEFSPSVDGEQAFPYLLKRKIGNTSKDVFIIQDKADAAKYAEQLKSDEFYCQAMVPGKYEYATHILFKNKRIVKSLNIEYRFEVDHPIKFQDHHHYRGICPCPHLDVFAQMLLSLGFEGLCCFNYKEQLGRPMVFEINPRLGASLCDYLLPFVTAAIQDRGD